MIVVDASVLATALIDDGEPGRAVREQLSDRDLIAPALIGLEVASVLTKSLRKQLLSEHRAALALADLADLPMERVPHLGCCAAPGSYVTT